MFMQCNETYNGKPLHCMWSSNINARYKYADSVYKEVIMTVAVNSSPDQFSVKCLTHLAVQCGMMTSWSPRTCDKSYTSHLQTRVLWRSLKVQVRDMKL